MAEVNIESIKIPTSKTIGFETKEDLLREINDRFTILNKFNIYLKKLPPKITRLSLREIIPEMVTCRFPERSKTGNKTYAFIQMPNESTLLRNLELLNAMKVDGKNLKATKLTPCETYATIANFDMTKLYFNGLKTETKYHEIKSLYTNAKINMPVDADKLSLGMVTLSFNSEEEAMAAFIENRLSLHGIKCQLNFLLKPKQKKDINEDSKDIVPNKEEECVDLFEEIISRLKDHNNRTVILKNLPNGYSLSQLKKLSSTMRNCKLSPEKKLGFVDFESSDLALAFVKEINGKIIDGKTVRAFAIKNNVVYNDLSEFNLLKIHLTNLSMNITKEDVEAIFKNCEVDFPLNVDGTCIGNSTLTFTTESEALQCFNSKTIVIKNITAEVNFHIAAKSNIKNLKRAIENTDDKTTEANNSKKIKLDESKDSNKSLTKENIISKKMPINANGDVHTEKKPIQRQRSMIPLTKPNIAKNNGKEATKEVKNVVPVAKSNKTNGVESKLVKTQVPIVTSKTNAETKVIKKDVPIKKSFKTNLTEDKSTKKTVPEKKVNNVTVAKSNEAEKTNYTLRSKNVKPELPKKTVAAKRKFDQVDKEETSARTVKKANISKK